jgi:hypothetical protein
MPSLEGITGRLGVGAVAFLGLFLMIDGAQPVIYDLIEFYGKSVTWGIVVVIPTAVVGYVIGVICLGVSELLLARFAAFRRSDLGDLLVVARTGSGMLERAYEQDTRDAELLKGLFVAFLILGGGVMAEVRNPYLRGYEAMVWTALPCAVALSALSLMFARRAVLRARATAKTIRESNFHTARESL